MFVSLKPACRLRLRAASCRKWTDIPFGQAEIGCSQNRSRPHPVAAVCRALPPANHCSFWSIDPSEPEAPLIMHVASAILLTTATALVAARNLPVARDLLSISAMCNNDDECRASSVYVSQKPVPWVYLRDLNISYRPWTRLGLV